MKRRKHNTPRYAVQHGDDAVYYYSPAFYRVKPVPLTWQQARDLKLQLEKMYYGTFNIIKL